MTIRHKLITPFVAVILTGMAATSCVSDGGEPSADDLTTGTSGVTFRISAAPFEDITTRATDHYGDTELAENPAAPNELIMNWVVAFIQNKKVVAVVEGNPGKSGTGAPSGVWNDRINLELPRGTYSAIAFANLDPAGIKSRLENLTLEDDWKNHIFDEKLIHTDNSRIPMSGYLEDFIVQGTVNEEFAIEVVRMKAKIEFAIKNLSSKQITVKSFMIKPVYNGKIFLFPEYDKKPIPNNEPGREPRFPTLAPDAQNPYITWTETARDGFSLDANSNKSERSNFYIMESVATGNHPTDHFHIGIQLQRGDETPEDVTYALADDALKFIYRNDYILFPIVISDYVPEFEVIDFPPIGGYPVRVEAVNNEFYATFSNSGAFDVTARLRDSQGRTVAIQPYDENKPQDNYVKYTGSDPERFSLTYDPALGTWQGNFDQGTNQHITLKFEFKIGDLIYTRTLHLISKN